MISSFWKSGRALLTNNYVKPGRKCLLSSYYVQGSVADEFLSLKILPISWEDNPNIVGSSLTWQEIQDNWVHQQMSKNYAAQVQVSEQPVNALGTQRESHHLRLEGHREILWGQGTRLWSSQTGKNGRQSPSWGAVRSNTFTKTVTIILLEPISVVYCISTKVRTENWYLKK